MNDQTIDHFLNELASGAPVPGGGSAAALAAATGAALVAMVCRLTVGREKFREHEETMTAALQAAEELRPQALSLAAEDAAAYMAVSEAYRLPRGTDEEKSTRTSRIEEALKGATDVPLRTVALSAQLIELCHQIVDGVNPNAISDVGVGALSARTALEGAALNVKTNLALIKDESFKAATTEQLQRYLAAARPQAGAVVQRVDASISS
jgi:formiminotetrahydrofolate cyclodeaminase